MQPNQGMNGLIQSSLQSCAPASEVCATPAFHTVAIKICLATTKPDCLSV